MTMRSNGFLIEGEPSIWVSLLELYDGSISITLTQLGNSVADIRGLFFDVTDATLLDNLVVTGSDVTGSAFGDEAITAISNDVNMNGSSFAPFDAGIEFGTTGIGQDDIFTTSFILSSTDGTALTLDLLSQVDFGVRLNSVGEADSQRKDSLKLTGVSTAAPDAINDFATTNEDLSTAGSLLANDTDADGDLLSVIEVNGVAANVNTQIALASGALLLVNSNGSYSYAPNQQFEYLAVGESTTESFTYRIFDGAFGYDTATATVTIEGVNDAPEITLVAGDSASAVLIETDNELATEGTLTVTDVDITDLVSPSVQSLSISGDTNGISDSELLSYLSVGPNPVDSTTTTVGTLNWIFNSSTQSFDYLAVGESLVLDYTVGVQDDSGSVNGTDTQLVRLTINGTNDAPIAAVDSAGTKEDTAITIDVLANDTDVDKTDILSVSRIIDAPDNGIVVINADNTLTYSPNSNYSGIDQLAYEISDGNGGFSTAVVDLAIEAVADAPDLMVDVLQGDRINEIKLWIRSALTDRDGSETLRYSIEGVPSGVDVSGSLTGTGADIEEYITLTLPEDSDSNFNIEVIATSTESSNNDQATVSVIKNINYDATFNDFDQTFLATDRNMWSDDEAFIFTDNRFWGIDTELSDNYNALVYSEYDLKLKAGLESNLEISGGSIDASLPYNFDFNTFYNRTTDALLIKPTATLLSGGQFTTDSPGGKYALDFIFQLDGYARGGLDFGELGRLEFFDEDYNVDKSTNIFTIDSDNAPIFSIPINDKYGISIDLQFPSIDTVSTFDGGNTFSSSGASNNFLQLTLDVDQLFAAIALKGINPFDLELKAGDILLAELELLDLDLLAGANFLQDFTLEAKGFDALLTVEDGTQFSINFEDDFLISNASRHDANGDGIIEFSTSIDLEAWMSNSTDLGFNVGYNFDLIKGQVLGSKFGPVVDLGETFPIASIPIYDTSFSLDFGSQNLSFAA